MDTRWSSPASDPQWLSIDLGRATTVCGLVICWETAFSREYEILVSDNGRKWKSVFKASTGDGRSDEVYFRPVQARFLKILCISRGTGWGYSIWEVDVKGPAEQPVVEPAGMINVPLIAP